MSLFSATVDMLQQATAYAFRRHGLLAQNTANVETPGFKARDLAFDAELTIAQRAQALPVADLHAPDLDVRMIQSRDPRERPDGNNVDIDQQMVRIQDNAGYHNVVVQLLNSRFNALKSAINGRT